MKINESLELVEYMNLVQSLADGFFDNNTGEYIPHVGELNAIREFFNHCVTLEEGEQYVQPAQTLTDMERLVKNGEFMTYFDLAVQFPSRMDFNFANAYYAAKDMVNVRNTSASTFVGMIDALIEKLITEFKNGFTEERIEQLGKLVEQIGDTKITEEGIVEAYGNSDHYRLKTKDFSEAVAKRKAKTENRK